MKIKYLRFVTVILGALFVSIFTGCVAGHPTIGWSKPPMIPPGYRLVREDASLVAPPQSIEAVRVIGGNAPTVVDPAVASVVVPKPPGATNVPPAVATPPASAVIGVIPSGIGNYKVEMYNPLEVPVTVSFCNGDRKFDIPANNGRVRFPVAGNSLITPYTVFVGKRIFIGEIKHVPGQIYYTIVLSFPPGVK